MFFRDTKILSWHMIGMGCMVINLCLSFSYSVASDKHGVWIIEFEAKSDKLYKDRFHERIEREIERSKEVSGVELIEKSRMDDWTSFGATLSDQVKKYEIRYIITGRIESFPEENQMRLLITLEDNLVDETLLWEVTIPKKSEVILRWRDMVTRKIQNRIEGKPYQSVFAHCFRSTQENIKVPEIIDLVERLPLKLKTELEGELRGVYLVETMTSNKISSECIKSTGSTLEERFHDYVVSGRIKKSDEHQLTIAVSIKLKEKESDFFDMDVAMEQAKNCHRWIAERIINKLPRGNMKKDILVGK